jgi:hypothetical protein
MGIIKSYSDLKQSKVLSKVLSDESADMVYLYWIKGDSHRGTEEGIDTIPTIREGLPMEKCDIPCWSLAALLNILPEIQGSKPIITLDDNYITYPHMSGLHTKADNLIDACYEMIIKLNELNLL